MLWDYRGPLFQTRLSLVPECLRAATACAHHGLASLNRNVTRAARVGDLWNGRTGIVGDPGDEVGIVGSTTEEADDAHNIGPAI